MATRKISHNKFGLAEDPRGQIATWKIGERNYICEITMVRYEQVRGCFVLSTRHFNGEPGPDVACHAVTLLLPD